MKLRPVEAGYVMISFTSLSGPIITRLRTVAVADAFHVVPIARQVTPDDISQRRVIVDHDDPPRPVGVGVHPYTVDAALALRP